MAIFQARGQYELPGGPSIMAGALMLVARGVLEEYLFAKKSQHSNRAQGGHPPRRMTTSG
ncbi:hypothetical protein A7E75_01755 [Syntrophotalea acetylenica]|uniref:Uncharacterized protein n=1 Tax=Syntrophotalea acetylenica TaxID=29542 RepID=A0A1L3GD58_SYNAC|nr:hypothetical protein A7E75_01755 [Syntrophotalea acetylenica]APG44470.1 hypothetical protein A6070_10370 [Syntrophotalea acetylenica]